MILCFAVVACQAVAFIKGRSIQGRRGQDSAEGAPALPTARADV
jgi:hypothetical protein